MIAVLICISCGQSGLESDLSTNWLWTVDSRGGGSQDLLSISGDVITIAPAAHVHFTNLDRILGSGIYRFRFKTQTRFMFAWRISPTDPQHGTGLIFQTEGNVGVSLIHVDWSGFYYGWHNAGSFRNTVEMTFDRAEWHDVEIRDTGNEITILFDGQILPLFGNEKKSVRDFFVGVGEGYVGVGGGDNKEVQYTGITFTR